MRNIYLDETGISVNEPIALVAGVIINEDAQWKAVEKAIAELVEKYVPDGKREGFSFHAKDLYFCTGKVFDHRKCGYPRERAREALKELLSIPRRFHLPVSVGYLTKAPGPDNPATTSMELTARESAKFFHGIAYFLCAVAAESYMRRNGLPDELIRLVAENNRDTQEIVKVTHKILQGKYRRDVIDKVTSQFDELDQVLPVERIVDTVHFVEKDDAPLIQLADACAFVLRYWAEGKSGEYVEPYFEALFGLGPDLDFLLTHPAPPFFQSTWIFPEPPIA